MLSMWFITKCTIKTDVFWKPSFLQNVFSECCKCHFRDPNFKIFSCLRHEPPPPLPIFHKVSASAWSPRGERHNHALIIVPSDWPIDQQSEITDYRLFMPQSARNRCRFYNDVIISVDRVKVTSFMSLFNDNFQRNMLLQPKIVKTVNKWHASGINLTYCVNTQRASTCNA
jgi:hypothetical protein